MRHISTLRNWTAGPASLALIAVLASCSAVGSADSAGTAGSGDAAGDAVAISAPAARPLAARAGQRVPGLDFAADRSAASVEPSVASPDAAGDDDPAAPAPATAAEARSRFAAAIVDDDPAKAFALLTPSDRTRFISAQRFAVELANEPAWLSAVTADDGTVRVTRTPTLDPVLGLVTPTATVTLPTDDTDGVPRIAWSRRTIEARALGDEAALPATVMRWATARRACSTSARADETDAGILGVVGLATALCGASGSLAVGGPDQLLYLLDLDDPAAVLDAYGSEAATWARVVPISAPVPMNVVLAPLGDAWKVIATVHPTLDQQQRSGS